MLFTISRTSDDFRADPRPSKNWQPHAKSFWDDNRNNWFVSVEKPEEIVTLIKEKRVIVRKGETPHIEIDDITDIS